MAQLGELAMGGQAGRRWVGRRWPASGIASVGVMVPGLGPAGRVGPRVGIGGRMPAGPLIGME